MDTALSDADILRIIPEANIIMSSDLSKLQRLPRLPIVLLYETADAYGHWVLIHSLPHHLGEAGTIEFFDSYGFKPDDELRFIPPDYLKKSKQTKKEIVRLLLDDPRSANGIVYNEHNFQGDSNTCGRWVIIRYLYSLLPHPRSMSGGGGSLQRFKKFIDDSTKRHGVSGDALTVMLTTS